MNRKALGVGIVGVALALGRAQAADLEAPAPGHGASTGTAVFVAQAPSAPPSTPPAAPTTPADQRATTPTPDTNADAFAQQNPSPSSEAAASYSPQLVGDFPGITVLRPVTITGTSTITTIQTITTTTTQVIRVPIGGSQEFILVTIPVTTTTQVPTTTVVPTTRTLFVPVPILSHEAFKVGENEGPRPEDRVFITYNFYSNAPGGLSTGFGPTASTFSTIVAGNPTTIVTAFPGVAALRGDEHREVLGFEKTFLDGNASIGLRAPFVQLDGDGGFSGSDFGDLSIILKYALYNDRRTQDVWSAGLVVTAPTGPGIPTLVGDLHPTLLQPWTGALFHIDSFYVQGISSVVFPTDSQDVTVMFNDLAVGYVLYRGTGDSTLRAVIPTLEAHVTTPLDHRNANDFIHVPDIVDLTEAVHLNLGGPTWLTLGVCTPVTGPRPFDVEAIVQLNWRF